MQRIQDFSMVRDSFFFNSKAPFEKIMMVFYIWVHQCKIMKIVAMSGLSVKTVEHYVSKLEEIIATDLDEEEEIIGGEGIEVQIDESKFGKRKCNRGHHVEGA